jgi:hypothetical protein
MSGTTIDSTATVLPGSATDTGGAPVAQPAAQAGVADQGQQNQQPAAPVQTDSASPPAAQTTEPAPAAPIEYTDFTVPEGILLDQQLMPAFKEVASKAGLKQEQAQMMIEMGAQLQQKILKDHFATVEQQKADWEAAARADKEIGGDKFDENLSYAAKAASVFVTPELQEQLNKTGLGNHPDMIRLFIRAGKMISEDTLVPGDKDTAADKDKTLAQKMFPDMNP